MKKYCSCAGGYINRLYSWKIFKLMRNTLLLVFITVLQAYAGDTYSQNTKLTLNLNNVTVADVLEEIQNNSGFYFLFNAKLIDIERKVSVSMEDKKISEILTSLFSGTGVNYMVYDKQIILTPGDITSMSAAIQQLKVTGTVTDKNGPIPGVNVLVTGTTQGTMTDITGNYSIEVPQGARSLTFSFIGMESQVITIGTLTQINVTMTETAIDLEEVVVVGYTSKKLSELSSSISTISSQKLKDVTSDNLSDMLQGKAPGVVVSTSSGNPNVEPSVIIRGSSSITAGSQPLYVVDGIIGGSADPQDIETISVLKDAAATGLYGSRASNGVIIITTKKGRSGKAIINFNSTVGLSIASEGKYQVMNSQQLYDYQKTFWNPATWDSERPSSLLSQDTDWHDLMFSTGIIQRYVGSVSGGSEKIQFYVSGNYYNEEGTLGPTSNKLVNIRSNISYNISNKLKLSVNLNARARRMEEEAAGSNFLTTHENMPWDNPYNTDGTLKVGTEEEWIGRDNDNFLHGWQYNFDKTNQNSLSGDVNLDYKITKNITFSSNNRYSFSDSKRVLYYDVRAKAGGSEGRLTNTFPNSTNFITSNRLLYSQNFNKHHVSAIAVAEAEKNYSDLVSLYGTGLAAGLHVIGVASVIGSATSSTGENAFSKGLVQLDYNFDNRYFIIGSGIRESSSRFGANNRAANFYTLASSWMLSNESFMKNQKILDLLKIRASYGLVGNAQIGNYQTLGLYSFSTQYAGNPGSYPSQLASEDLTWEKAEILNFGLDVGFWKRITINTEVYQKLTHALLLGVEIPFTTGFQSVMQNVGSVRNRGLEINLNTINLNGKFRWETNFNIALNKNKVLSLDKGKDILQGGTGADPGRIIRVGEDLNSWYLRKWAGVNPDNGDPQWEAVSIDENGNRIVSITNVYSDATLQVVGNYTPKFTGGFTNIFSYKSLSLSAFFNFVKGIMVYNYSEFVVNSDGAYDAENQVVLAHGESRWEKPGDIATHPKPIFGGNLNSNRASSRYLHDGSYIRMRNVKLSYNLPNNLLTRMRIAKASIYISGDNLWTGTPFTGKDPEANLELGGGQVANYPISQKILVGINLEL